MNKEKKICSISFYVFEMKFPKRSDNENVFSINDISINKIDIDLSCFHSSNKRKIWFNEEQSNEIFDYDYINKNRSIASSIDDEKIEIIINQSNTLMIKEAKSYLKIKVIFKSQKNLQA